MRYLPSCNQLNYPPPVFTGLKSCGFISTGNRIRTYGYPRMKGLLYQLSYTDVFCRRYGNRTHEPGFSRLTPQQGAALPLCQPSISSGCGNRIHLVTAYETVVCTSSTYPQYNVVIVGFEPTTNRVSDDYSTWLSYMTLTLALHPRIELGPTGLESVWLPQPVECFFVEIPRFELGTTECKSVMIASFTISPLY